MISREAAAEIALSDALTHHLGFAVLKVLSVDEICGRAPTLYNVNLRDCWIVYIEHPDRPALRASTIIVVSRSDGNVIYRGAANDEG